MPTCLKRLSYTCARANSDVTLYRDDSERATVCKACHRFQNNAAKKHKADLENAKLEKEYAAEQALQREKLEEELRKRVRAQATYDEIWKDGWLSESIRLNALKQTKEDLQNMALHVLKQTIQPHPESRDFRRVTNAGEFVEIDCRNMMQEVAAGTWDWSKICREKLEEKRLREDRRALAYMNRPGWLAAEEALAEKRQKGNERHELHQFLTRHLKNCSDKPAPLCRHDNLLEEHVSNWIARDKNRADLIYSHIEGEKCWLCKPENEELAASLRPPWNIRVHVQPPCLSYKRKH